MKGWETFFAAQIAASAALAGLVFVGASINWDIIREFDNLRPRVCQALTAAMAVLLASVVLLVPEQPLILVGIEMLVIGLSILGIMAWTIYAVYKGLPGQYRWRYAIEVVAIAVATLVFVGVGVAMLRGNGSSVYGIALGIIFYYIVVILDAWIFLMLAVQRGKPRQSCGDK